MYCDMTLCNLHFITIFTTYTTADVCVYFYMCVRSNKVEYNFQIPV